MRSLVFLTILGSSAIAFADPTVTVSPNTVHPGEAVLVTVTGATAEPHGKAGGRALEFFAAKGGYQAVFAVPLKIDEDHVLVEVTDGAKPVSIPIVAKTFPETKLVVEDELANPDKEQGRQIDADNAAIEKSYDQAKGAPQFTRAFHRPPGTVTSTFGEWRTFNDGHRSQHLGIDVGAREGARVVGGRCRHGRARPRDVSHGQRRRDRPRRRYLVAVLPPLEGHGRRGRSRQARASGSGSPATPAAPPVLMFTSVDSRRRWHGRSALIFEAADRAAVIRSGKRAL